MSGKLTPCDVIRIRFMAVAVCGAIIMSAASLVCVAVGIAEWFTVYACSFWSFSNAMTSCFLFSRMRFNNEFGTDGQNEG